MLIPAAGSAGGRGHTTRPCKSMLIGTPADPVNPHLRRPHHHCSTGRADGHGHGPAYASMKRSRLARQAEPRPCLSQCGHRHTILLRLSSPPLHAHARGRLGADHCLRDLLESSLVDEVYRGEWHWYRWQPRESDQAESCACNNPAATAAHDGSHTPPAQQHEPEAHLHTPLTRVNAVAAAQQHTCDSFHVDRFVRVR